MGTIQNTLIYEALNTLNDAERREFLQFLHTPFFNNKPVLSHYGAYLLQCIASRQDPEQQQIYALVAKSARVLPEQSLRLANSALLRLLEQWWQYRAFVEKNERTGLQLVEVYRKRGLPRHYKTARREAEAQRERSPLRNAAYWEETFQLSWEHYQYEVGVQRAGKLNLQECSDGLDTAFMANKLRLACLALSHQAVYKTDYEIAYLPEILQRIHESYPLQQLPALGLYYHCYQFLTGKEGAAHFSAFITLLSEAAEQFPEEELRLLYLLAINYGIRQINKSADGAIESTFELYKGALQRNLLLENGYISRFAFSNIVAISLRAGHTDWVEGFIEKYKTRLERQWREAITHLSLARLEYERRQYQAALLHLQRADYKDTMNNLSAKILQMKIYYETGATDTLEHHLKNLKKYIQRHTAIGYHRVNYSNIVHYTEQLTLVNPLDGKAVAQLKAAISSEKTLTEKEWLLSMAAQL